MQATTYVQRQTLLRVETQKRFFSLFIQFIHILLKFLFVSCCVDFIEYFSAVGMQLDVWNTINFNHGIYVNYEQD